MKEPVFTQLDRLADYDDGLLPNRRQQRRVRRRELDELLREDGRVQGDDDADA